MNDIVDINDDYNENDNDYDDEHKGWALEDSPEG